MIASGPLLATAFWIGIGFVAGLIGGTTLSERHLAKGERELRAERQRADRLLAEANLLRREATRRGRVKE